MINTAIIKQTREDCTAVPFFHYDACGKLCYLRIDPAIQVRACAKWLHVAYLIISEHNSESPGNIFYGLWLNTVTNKCQSRIDSCYSKSQNPNSECTYLYFCHVCLHVLWENLLYQNSYVLFYL